MIAMMVVMMRGMLLGGAWAFLSGRKRVATIHARDSLCGA
jgi:hypothetical protein